MAFNFDIHQNIIQLYNYKNNNIVSSTFIDRALETNMGIRKAKRYGLVPKVIIISFQKYFPFITFSNLYPMI